MHGRSSERNYWPLHGYRVPDGPLLGLPAFDDAKLLHIREGAVDVLQELGEIDMGSPQTLAWFVATGGAM